MIAALHRDNGVVGDLLAGLRRLDIAHIDMPRHDQRLRARSCFRQGRVRRAIGLVVILFCAMPTAASLWSRCDLAISANMQYPYSLTRSLSFAARMPARRRRHRQPKQMPPPSAHRRNRRHPCVHRRVYRWMDMTGRWLQGDWVYRQDDRGSIALFGPQIPMPSSRLRCDKGRAHIPGAGRGDRATHRHPLQLDNEGICRRSRLAARRNIMAAEIMPRDPISRCDDLQPRQDCD